MTQGVYLTEGRRALHVDGKKVEGEVDSGSLEFYKGYPFDTIQPVSWGVSSTLAPKDARESEPPLPFHSCLFLLSGPCPSGYVDVRIHDLRVDACTSAYAFDEQ